MDVDIKACMDEIIFGRPEKSGHGRRMGRPRKPSQHSCSSAKKQEITSASNNADTISSETTGVSSEKWMDNSFMPNEKVVSKNGLHVAHTTKIRSENSVIDESSHTSSACIQNAKSNCKARTKNPNVRCSKEDTQLVSTLRVESHSDSQIHAVKRSSSELGKLETNCSSDLFDDHGTGCKRSKTNEVESNGFHDSFNDSSSFLQSIDFDFIDACVNMNLHSMPSSISTSSVAHSIQVTNENGKGSSHPESRDAVENCGKVDGQEVVTPFIPSKCDPTNVKYETAGPENAVNGDLTVARKNQVTETQIAASKCDPSNRKYETAEPVYAVNKDMTVARKNHFTETQIAASKCDPSNRKYETAGPENAVNKDLTVARKNQVTETQIAASKCDPSNRKYETARPENAVNKDLTVARKDQVTEKRIAARSETGKLWDGTLNILQVIDASDSIPVHHSGSIVNLINCDSKAATSACPDSVGAVVNAEKSSISTPTLVANRRMSLFASRIRKTLAANARIDTPIRIRPPASILDDAVFEDLGAEGENGQRHSSYPDDTFYGLPLKVQQLFKEQRSISELYDWQKECLRLKAICDGTNLIYSLPTSGGKTLVAEMLILRQLLCLKKDAIIILPFVAIVQEKVRGLSSFAVELDFAVEEYAASKGQIPPRQRRSRCSLYVATIEKASSLINCLIENKRLNSVGLVVVDELHMLGEGGSRGAVLETTLTKVMHSSASTQIVGMSATLSNVKDIQRFLNAEIYSSNFRPVELKEYVKIADTIYEVDGAALDPDDLFKFSRVTAFKYDREMTLVDPDHLTGLVLEVIPNNSCLVFCPTKKNCENVAQLLCKMIPKEMCGVRSKERRLLYESLKLEGSGVVCPVLRATIPYGIAYHHSGLTSDERKLIEEAYLEGTLCVLSCTSTLAAGVNLPARRVILRSPYVGRNFISKSQYKQMTGRAGRAGIDTSGESILIVNATDRKKLPDLIGGSYDRCLSSLLYEGNKGMRSLLLSTIGLQITPTTNDLLTFVKRTLCDVQSKLLNVNMVEITQNALQQLVEAGLVQQRTADGKTVLKSCRDLALDLLLDVTNLGRAVFKGSIDVDCGTKLYGDLSSAQQSIVLANYLHLLYLVTPYDMVGVAQAPRWMTYLRELGSLTASELKVASLIGVTEGHVAKKAAGQTSRQVVDEFSVNRFYLTLMLYNLWKQRTIWDVSERFHVTRGFVQQLLNGAASFGACVNHFCQELEEFWGYQDLLNNFVKKLSFCCSMELIPLLEIPGIKMGRARQLHRAGFRSLQHIAYANTEDLVKQIEHLPRHIAKQIVSSAQMLLTEKAEALMEEVDNMIALPDNISLDRSIAVKIT